MRDGEGEIMSVSAVDDLMAMMEQDGIGVVGRDIYDWRMAKERQATHGVLVRQRTSSPEPDHIT